MRLAAAGAGAIGLIVMTLALTWVPRQQYAHFGDFRLQSGETIADLVVGYRTAGRLDASRSNAVLVAPWLQGTSVELARQIGPDKLVDTSTNFVILVDALGNGVSSSPSTSTRQPGASFPRFTIGDIVETQRLLVTQTLQLTRLRAVVGISMGGMQVFEWAVAHPDMIDVAVPIVGSPKSQPDDLERWKEGIQHVQVSTWTRVRTELSAGRLLAALGELRNEPVRLHPPGRGDHGARRFQALRRIYGACRSGHAGAPAHDQHLGGSRGQSETGVRLRANGPSGRVGVERSMRTPSTQL